MGAARHLDGGWLEDALEIVWDQVALEWGMDASTFKTSVRKLTKLTEGELVTKEELRIELRKPLGARNTRSRYHRAGRGAPAIRRRETRALRVRIVQTLWYLIFYDGISYAM
jgi:hypothetical protein